MVPIVMLVEGDVIMLIAGDVAPIRVRCIETEQVYESGERVGGGGGSESGGGEKSDSEDEGKGGIIEEELGWGKEGRYRGYYYVCETPVLDMIQSLPELLKQKTQAPTRPKSWFSMEEENREVSILHNNSLILMM